MAAAAARLGPSVVLPGQLPDEDPAETQEWLESLDAHTAAGTRRSWSTVLSARPSE